jgi:hypothetical protein
MRVKIKKLSILRNIVYILPLLFMFTILILHLALPEKTFSNEERRYLQQWPAFHVERLFDGSYETKMESYFSDQFPFRSFWIHVYSMPQNTLLLPLKRPRLTTE